MLAKRRYSLLDLFAGWWIITFHFRLQPIHQLTCCWLRVIQEITVLMSLLSWFCSLWFVLAPPHSQAGNSRLYPWSSDTCCSTAALLLVNNMLQMHQEISVSAITKKRVNKDGGSVKKEKKRLLIWIWRRGVCMGKGAGIFQGRRYFPEWSCGHYRKSWHLKQQHTPCQDTRCFHSIKCSFPSRLKNVKYDEPSTLKGVRLQLDLLFD